MVQVLGLNVKLYQPILKHKPITMQWGQQPYLTRKVGFLRGIRKMGKHFSLLGGPGALCQDGTSINMQEMGMGLGAAILYIFFGADFVPPFFKGGPGGIWLTTYKSP